MFKTTAPECQNSKLSTDSVRQARNVK